MANVHPSLRGKPQAEIERIFNTMQDGLSKSFYGTLNGQSFKDQDEVVQKVCEILSNRQASDFFKLMKAVAQDAKADAWDILKEMADNAIESFVDGIIYPCGGEE